jgi:nucleolar protein 58
LKTFQKFDSAATALEEVAALVEGKVTPSLASLLNSIKDEKKVSLAVADEKLGTLCIIYRFQRWPNEFKRSGN